MIQNYANDNRDYFVTFLDYADNWSNRKVEAYHRGWADFLMEGGYMPMKDNKFIRCTEQKASTINPDYPKRYNVMSYGVQMYFYYYADTDATNGERCFWGKGKGGLWRGAGWGMSSNNSTLMRINFFKSDFLFIGCSRRGNLFGGKTRCAVDIYGSTSGDMWWACHNSKVNFLGPDGHAAALDTGTVMQRFHPNVKFWFDDETVSM